MTDSALNILHIDTEKGFRGGEGQVMALMRGLRARGIHQALAAYPGEELARRAASEGFTVHEKPAVSDWLARRFVQRLIRGRGYNLLHAHTGNAHTLAWRAAGAHIPVVVTRRVDFPVKNNVLSRRKYLAPGIYYIAISRAVAEVLRAGGVPADRITIVHSGIDPFKYRGATGRQRLRMQWNVTEPGPVVGFVGAYVDHKDPLNLIEAAARAELPPSAKIILVGEGELRPALAACIAKHHLQDRVILTGWRDDIGDCLAAFDLFVMPSKLEGLCTSLLDAQAAGVACVACAAGGIPDIIEHEENGLLVPVREPDALARAMERVVNDAALRERIAAAGPPIVAKRFTDEQMVRGTVEVYERVMGIGQR